MLVDWQLRKALSGGLIGVDDYDPALIQPNSLDVRLDKHFLVPWDGVKLIDTAAVPPNHMGRFESDTLTLMPRDFVLASTLETFHLPEDVVARVEGKSSLARLGLLVHVTAGFIDSGFSGQVTLEIVNLAPWQIRLHAGMTIGQVCFEKVARVDRSYSKTGRYQGQRGPTESRYTGASFVNSS